MKKRIFNLISNTILKNEFAINDDVESGTDVVERTYYNYWKEIDTYLASLGMDGVITFDNKTLRFHGDDDDRAFLIDSLNSMDFYEYHLSSDERKGIIAATLALSDFPMTYDQFKEILCVSKNTIVNDIKDLRNDLKEMDIDFDQNKQAGFLLDAYERKRRRLLLNVLLKQESASAYFNVGPKNPCIVYLKNLLKLDKYFHLAEKAVGIAEEQLQTKISDYDYYQVILILIISIVRIKNDHEITYEYPIHLENPQVLYFAEHVFNGLSNEVKYNRNEVHFLNENLQIYNVIPIKENNVDDSTLFSIITKELIAKMSLYYRVNLGHDTSLYQYLAIHLAACFHRVKQMKSLDNPLLKEIQKQHYEDLQELKRNIYILENALNISLSDDEIAYILLHILASLESVSKKEVLIMVVCDSGFATRNYLTTLIKQRFNVNVIKCNQLRSLNELLSTNKVDLIVTTTPLQTQNVPVILVNAILSDTDLFVIQKAIQTIRQPNIEEDEEELNDNKNVSSILFSNLLEVDDIVLEVEATDWKEAIMSAGEILLWKKKISVNYMRKMIDLVLQFGPYIVLTPGIAFAHASYNDGVLSPGVSIIRLKNPVYFGKEGYDPVNIVIACGVLNTPEYTNIFIQFMTLIRNPKFKEVLLNAKEPKEILDFLHKFDKSITQ